MTVQDAPIQGPADPAVLRALTTLLVPVTWGDDRPAFDRAQRLLSRSFGAVRFWDPGDARRASQGVEELAPAFRELLHFRTGERTDGERWRGWRLCLSPAVMSGLLAAPALLGRRGERWPAPKVVSVELYLFPMGAAVLALQFDWTAGPDPISSLSELVRRLAALTVLSDGDEGRQGWTFEEVSANTRAAAMPAALKAALDGGAAHLRTLIDYLLVVPQEDPAAPHRRCPTGRHLTHHSAVTLSGPPASPDRLDALLWWLRGASDARHRPPPLSEVDRHQPRSNRRLSYCREGCIALNWPDGEDSRQFEVESWAQRFQVVYLLLSVHVHAERATLLTLAAEAARLAADLDGPDKTANRRDDIYALAQRMTRYTLSMVGDDPGGRTEYAAHFRAVRETLGVPAALAEVRAELDELFHLVEAARGIVAERAQVERDRHERAFHRRATLLGVILGPATLVTGIFGANLHPELPIGAWGMSFWLIVACGAVAWLVYRRAPGTRP